MANEFNTYLNNLLSIEGGKTVDHRGVTNYGITQPTYDEYRKAKKLPIKSVNDLTYGETKDFYENEFFTKPQIDKVAKISSGAAGIMFDYAVNAGNAKAIKDLQTIIGAKADGIIGPKTLASIEKYVKKNGDLKLKKALLTSQANHYDRLISEAPEKYGKFANGWKNRVAKTASLYANE